MMTATFILYLALTAIFILLMLKYVKYECYKTTTTKTFTLSLTTIVKCHVYGQKHTYSPVNYASHVHYVYMRSYRNMAMYLVRIINFQNKLLLIFISSSSLKKLPNENNKKHLLHCASFFNYIINRMRACISGTWLDYSCCSNIVIAVFFCTFLFWCV